MQNDIFSTQLKILMDHYNLTSSQLARKCKIPSYVMIDSYLANETRPTIKTIKKICDRFVVNQSWIMFGIGEMQYTNYREHRFKTYSKPTKTVKQKLTAILDIYEISHQEFFELTGIPKGTLKDYLYRPIDSIPIDQLPKLTKAFKEIPPQWYL